MTGKRQAVTKAIKLTDRAAILFWTKELRCTEALLRTAVRNVGTNTDRARAYLESINERDGKH